jgi:hypothetical protein
MSAGRLALKAGYPLAGLAEIIEGLAELSEHLIGFLLGSVRPLA